MKKLLFITVLLISSSLFAEFDIYKQWVFQTDGRIKAKPLILKDKIYLTSYDGKLYNLDATNAKEIWSFQTGNIISSSAIVDKDTLYIGSGDYHIYALNLKDGSKKWSFKANDMITRSPVIAKEVIFVGSADGYIYALNKSDGKLLWKENLNSSISADLVYKNRVLYVATIDNYIHAIYPKKQKSLWRYKMSDRVTIKPIYEDDTLYIADHSGEVVALDTHDGSKEWSYKSDAAVDLNIELVGDNLYVGSLDYSLYIIDKKTGDLKTSYLASDTISALHTNGENILLGTDRGYLVFLDKQGVFQGAQKLNSEITSIQIIQDILYVTDTTGNLYRLTLEGSTEPQILTPPSMPPPMPKSLPPTVAKKTYQHGITKDALDDMIKTSGLTYKKFANDIYRLEAKNDFSAFLRPILCSDNRCHILKLSTSIGYSTLTKQEKLNLLNIFNDNGRFIRVTLNDDGMFELTSELDLHTTITYEPIETFIMLFALQYENFKKTINKAKK